MKTQFLYFLKDVTERPKTEQLEALGLAHALAGESFDFGVVAHGPGGHDGMIVAHVGGDQRLGYYPAEQMWLPLNDHASVGWVTNAPMPGPSELQRKQIIAGHEVELGDGRHWIAPKARAWSTVRGELISGAALPCRLTMNGNNGWKPGAVLPAYAELEAIASGWWDERFAQELQEGADGGGAVAFTFADAPTMATRCLAASYRIGPVEADILGLWTTQTVVAVLDAAIDYPALVELLVKKKIAPAA